MPRLAAGGTIGTLLVSGTPPLAAQAMARGPSATHREAGARRRHIRPSARAACRRSAYAACGEFERGAVVACVSAAEGQELARGLINYLEQRNPPHRRRLPARSGKRFSATLTGGIDSSGQSDPAH